MLYNGTAFKILNLDRGYKLYDNIFESYEEVPGEHNVYKLKSNRKYGLFSKDFQQYFAPYYDDIISYQTEKCICLQNGKYGVVDSCNNVLLPFKYAANNSSKTRTIRCIKTPVRYMYE